jgi:hypothetical protein
VGAVCETADGATSVAGGVVAGVGTGDDGTSVACCGAASCARAGVSTPHTATSASASITADALEHLRKKRTFSEQTIMATVHPL